MARGKFLTEDEKLFLGSLRASRAIKNLLKVSTYAGRTQKYLLTFDSKKLGQSAKNWDNTQ